MYNPSLHTATNKPIGLINKPVDARTYYYDTATLSYRPYANQAEVLAYLIGTQRVGQFSIIIATAGVNAEWWFKDGVLDANLIIKNNDSSTSQFIPTGSAFPFVVDYSTLITTYGETPTPLFYDALTGNKRQWTDCYITFSGTNMLVYCHTNDGIVTSDDMYLILKV